MVIYAYFLVNSEDRFVYRASKQKECHISIHNSSQEIIFVTLKSYFGQNQCYILCIYE